MRNIASSLLCCLLFAGCSLAAYSTSYTVTDLGSYMRPTCINDSGVVAGYSLGIPKHAFAWQNGTTTWLPELGYTSSGARGINNSGQIVGLLVSSDGTDRGVLWQNGSATDLGFSGVALVINDAGQIAGWSTDNSGSGSTVITNLGSLGGPTNTVTRISNTGVIAGSANTADGYTDSNNKWHAYRHAYLGTPSALTDLGTLGGQESYGISMNDSGQVVGASESADGSHHAFLWQNGSMTDLGPGSATGINNSGLIIGFPAPGGPSILANGSWQSLSSMIPTDSGWTLQQVIALNNEGTIIGVGLQNGILHGFLLNPVDSAGNTPKGIGVLRFAK
jgi:probable HAF family extracellular repeat protein